MVRLDATSTAAHMVRKNGPHSSDRWKRHGFAEGHVVELPAAEAKAVRWLRSVPRRPGVRILWKGKVAMFKLKELDWFTNGKAWTAETACGQAIIESTENGFKPSILGHTYWNELPTLDVAKAAVFIWHHKEATRKWWAEE